MKNQLKDIKTAIELKLQTEGVTFNTEHEDYAGTFEAELIRSANHVIIIANDSGDFIETPGEIEDEVTYWYDDTFESDEDYFTEAK